MRRRAHRVLRPSGCGAQACRRSAAPRIRTSRACASSRPTHLVVNVDENRREAVDAARAFVPHVIVTHPMGPDDNPRLYALFGAIFGREREARALAASSRASMRTTLRMTRALPRERVLYVIWRKPWMTVARDTYMRATLARVGWDTVPATAAARYPELADDDAAWRDAQRILLSSEPYAFRARERGARAAHAAGRCISSTANGRRGTARARASDSRAARRCARARLLRSRRGNDRGRPAGGLGPSRRPLQRHAHADGDAPVVAVALAGGRRRTGSR